MGDKFKPLGGLSAHASSTIKRSDMGALEKRLAELVGPERAKKWVDQSFEDRVSYGMPADKKGNYTAYGVTRNIDVRPDIYLPTMGKPTVVPNKDWDIGAYGTHNLLQGIRIPETSPVAKFPSENVLTHEGQHLLDTYAGGNPANYRKDDADKLRRVLHATEQVKDEGSSAFTGRNDSGEVIPEIRDYASRLPAWSSLQNTDLFKGLPDELKAVVLRKLAPMPKDVDAVAGVDYNFAEGGAVTPKKPPPIVRPGTETMTIGTRGNSEQPLLWPF